jgi:S1-C subfamily serine protease
MKRRFPFLFLFTCLGLLTAAAPLSALEPAQRMARKLYEERQESIVWVSAVLKISMTTSGAMDSPINIPDQERTVDLLGTIIDPSGLVVVSHSQLDPSRELSNRQINTRDGIVTLDATVTLKEIRVTMADGTEIPAEQVMKDQHLDLSFIRINTDSKEADGVRIQAIDLSDDDTVNVSDEVITLSRTSEVLSRVPSVAIGQVTSLVKRPRTFIGVTGDALGCPTFNVKGKLIGICVRRTMKDKGAANVLLPAEDVLEIAEQAVAVQNDAR